MNQKKSNLIYLVLICLLGIWLRFDGLGWGLPFRLHPDEWKYVQGAAKCHMGEWNPKYFRNPPGYTYTNALWYPVWMHVAPTIEMPDWLEPQPAITDTKTVSECFFEQPYTFVLGARVVSALFGAGVIFLTFLLANLLGFNVKTALLAALLSSVSFVGVRESHFAVNDSAMAFWVVLSIAVGVYSVKINSLRWLCAAAVFSGIAVAFKYSAYPAVIALMLFRLASFAKIEAFDKQPLHIVRDIFAIGVLSVIAFLVICPFPITDYSTFMAEMQKLSAAASGGWQGQDAVWSGLLLMESLVRSEGVLSILFAVFGGYGLIRQKQWLYFVFPVLYALMLVSNPLYFTRFCLPLLPWVSLAAAFGINMIFNINRLEAGVPQSKVLWLRQFFIRFKTQIFLCSAVFLILQPGLTSLRSNYLLHQEDTRIQALRWLIEGDLQGKVAAGQFELPLVYWDTAEPWSTSYSLNIDPLPSNRLDVLDQYPIRFIAVSTFSAFPGKIPDSFRQRLQSVIQYVQTSEPETAFTVFDNSSTKYFVDRDIVRRVERADVEDTYSPTTRLWQRECLGPEILVFSTPSDQ